MTWRRPRARRWLPGYGDCVESRRRNKSKERPAVCCAATFGQTRRHHDGAGPGRVAGHLSAVAAASRALARQAPCAAREGPRHLADVDLGRGGRRGPEAGCRPARAGLPSRRSPGDHRREPAADVLRDDGGAVARWSPGADVPGRDRRRNGLRVPQRGDRLRDRRRPGAGRQDARSARAARPPEAHLLRRLARPAPLHAGRTAALRRTHPARGGTALRAAEVHRRGDREGLARRHGGAVLYVGNDRQAERRGADAPLADRPRPRVHRDGGPHRLRGRSGLPAAGLDRAEHLLLCAGAGHRLHGQLSRVAVDGDQRHARDRPDLLLRAAAGVRGPADAGDDPHGRRRRDQAAHVPLLHGRGQEGRRRHPRRQAGRLRRPAAVSARRPRPSTGRCATCSA